MKQISNWNIENLVHQVVFPRLNISDYKLNEEYKLQIQQLVTGGIGGFCIFGGNIESNISVIEELQFMSEIPLLFAGDFENGIAMRLSEGTEFPHSMALGKVNLDYTYQTAEMIAQEAKAIGVHWNFAPVADVNNNVNNPVINIRAFGEEVESVSARVNAYIEGTQKHKVLACAKHFPGHGNTAINSHLELPILDFTKEELFQNELLPFMQAISKDVKSIMMGHLSLPKIDESGLPASLSKIIIQDLLRNELKFDGLIVSDALEMEAITQNYSNKEIAHLGIEAGLNVFLMPEDAEQFIKTIIEVVQSNPDLITKLTQSVELIVKAKRWAGIMPQFQKENMPQDLFIRHPYQALKFADKALKVTGNSELIPLNESYIVSVFSLLQTSKDFDNATKFTKMLADANEFEMDFAFINEEVTQENIDEYKNMTEDAELVIFPIFVKGRTYGKTAELPAVFNYILKELSENKKSIAIIFGSPYIAEKVFSDTKILTYSDSYASLAAVVARLSNRDLNWIE
jgi:beta-glucosidase-like glycosyl hydrolase